MELELPLFINYLKETKNASASTVSSYQRDLRKLESYLGEHGVEHVENVTSTNLNSYFYIWKNRAGAFNGYCFTQCGFDEGFFSLCL